MAVFYDIKSSFKNDAITAAKELCYGDKVIERLKEAKNENEITRILVDARTSAIQKNADY